MAETETEVGGGGRGFGEQGLGSSDSYLLGIRLIQFSIRSIMHKVCSRYR